MAIDGVYSFVYCGTTGLGVGVFEVSDGKFTGRDFTGCTYTGTVVEDRGTGRIRAEIKMTVNPGTSLVQGTSEQEVPYTRQISHDFDPGFGDGVPQRLSVPPGEITVMIKRAPDEWASAATKGLRVVMNP
jgi:hypothetical protein